MFKFIKDIFKKDKQIAFLDGDQDVKPLIEVYTKYLKGIETHCVRQASVECAPKVFKDQPFNKIYLEGFAKGKEVTDKFIAGMIQKSIADGYTTIIVVSNDYDFFDIFKMALIMNPDHKNIKFKLITPKKCAGRIKEIENTSTIEIIKARG